MGNNSAPLTVSEIRCHPVGEQAWGKYIILEIQKRRTKDGKEICNLRLGDRTGEIESVIWDGTQVSSDYEVGKLMGAVGDIGQYNNRPQFIVRRFKLLDEDVTPYWQCFHLLWQESSEHQAASLGHRWIRSLSEAP